MVMVRGGSSASFRRSSDDMDDLGRSMHEEDPDLLILLSFGRGLGWYELVGRFFADAMDWADVRSLPVFNSLIRRNIETSSLASCGADACDGRYSTSRNSYSS